MHFLKIFIYLKTEIIKVFYPIISHAFEVINI